MKRDGWPFPKRKQVGRERKEHTSQLSEGVRQGKSGQKIDVECYRIACECFEDRSEGRRGWETALMTLLWYEDYNRFVRRIAGTISHTCVPLLQGNLLCLELLTPRSHLPITSHQGR